MDREGEMKGFSVIRTRFDFEKSSREAFEEALRQAALSREDVGGILATGYGRKAVPFAEACLTEISCQARGCFHYFPRPITIVDIGGQDNKIIHLASDGRRLSFRMNRKCAAGTGAFLEELAARMDLPIEDLDRLARAAKGEEEIGSFCTVFSSTEILAKMRKGSAVEDIVKGIYRSIIKRIAEMEPLCGDVVLTGGVVAHHGILVEMMQEKIPATFLLPPRPQVTCALGAALLAAALLAKDKNPKKNKESGIQNGS